MKIYISQGHEKGIGLEVFFKSILLLNPREMSHLTLLAFKSSVESTLKALRLPFKLTRNGVELCDVKLNVTWLEDKNFSESFTAINLGMKLAETGGILYTLPTSKNQFPNFAGHTEYFRSFYQKQDLGMFFSSPDLQVLLLSDHLPIRNLSQVLTEELIYSRLHGALVSFENWNWPIARILVAGLNPHAGEGGLIGDEDQKVTAALKRLKSKHRIDMSGPLPGDTMLLEKKSPQDLLVYLFHDQGLGVFKGLQGFIGSNITLGLPYPRFSPDHGTSFKIFGKNEADYRGCLYSLREALSLAKRISHGKDSSH